ncbi:3-phosphoshikimate 1-carboxyvinyltransferase [Dehalococcoides sp. THU3]|uniref:3-phosphoshikimate 1-carboxyvinyltransferase n=1 Tax=Dehalococcoides TaxID=61434 RepID=UPI0005B577FF|nr:MULTISPECIES: 3-phosphoshikimate 1-carboxyvinyltransferase [Dehalococcoides]QYY58299.1 3-phosphoshikimate 1-carboxyvinyltransferase [Dehalococcoides mccartyi]BAQ34353.1 3-phosphoshikimate 1-carboxyvinyltransferase [Dehalococcoides sp. UCH007]
MKIHLAKSLPGGEIAVPSSKSYTIRGLVAAAQANGQSHIISPLIADDTLATRQVLSGLGIDINTKTEDGSWQITGNTFKKPEGNLFCRESAATLRFMSAVCARLPFECHLLAGHSLMRRPMLPLIQALHQLGIEIETRGNTTVIKGGEITRSKVSLPGNISSQYVSALMLMAPACKNGLEIHLATPPASLPYLKMTKQTLESFGIKVFSSINWQEISIPPQPYLPARYRVEGDWSSASSFLALGAIAAPVFVSNLDTDSFQADRIMIKYLTEMGAEAESGQNWIKVSPKPLSAINADLTHSIDLLPALAVAAACAKGQSILSGVRQARIKESNRIRAVSQGLVAMGINVTEEDDRLIIDGGYPKGTEIDSFGDHRIAMAFGVLGAVVGETHISDAECVSKTYPGFWEQLESLGGKVIKDV